MRLCDVEDPFKNTPVDFSDRKQVLALLKKQEHSLQQQRFVKQQKFNRAKKSDNTRLLSWIANDINQLITKIAQNYELQAMVNNRANSPFDVLWILKHKMMESSEFDNQDVTLDHLYRVQKARVQEFILQANAAAKSQGLQTTIPDFVKDLWYNEPAEEWTTAPNPQFPKFVKAHARVYAAKQAFETAGGRYPYARSAPISSQVFKGSL